MGDNWRFAIGGIGAPAIGALVWSQISGLHPAFSQLAFSGFIPWIPASMITGAIAGACAPHHKVVFASCVGFLVSTALLAFLLRNGWSHYDRSPLLWYGPIALIPAGCTLGGFLILNAMAMRQPSRHAKEGAPHE